MKLRPPIPLAVVNHGVWQQKSSYPSVRRRNPASADAENFPNGKVQFTPTGVFNKAPTPVASLPVCSAPNSGATCITAWSTSPDTIATVDQNGVVECLPG